MKNRFQEFNIEIARPSQTTVVLQNLSVAPSSDPAEAEEGRRRTPLLALPAHPFADPWRADAAQ